MDEHLKHTLELDKDIASLFHAPSPPMPPAVLERTKLAVRHELNEQWLAARAETNISVQALSRTKAAVREYVQRSKCDRPEPVRASEPRFFSFLAAAAVILLCIGLVQHAAGLKKTTELAVESVEMFVESGDTSSQDDLLTTIASDLAAVEANIGEWNEEFGDWALDEAESDSSEPIG